MPLRTLPPLAKLYGLLEPGPVVLLTTARGGRANDHEHNQANLSAHNSGVPLRA